MAVIVIIFYVFVWLLIVRASLVAQVIKNVPAIQETWARSLGWEDLLEEGLATHSSILAWRIPVSREESLCATVHAFGKRRTRLSD